MTILVGSDTNQTQLIQSALGGAAQVVHTLAEAEEALEDQVGEFAVLVGPSVRDVDAFAFSERWRVHRPALSIILIRPRVDRQVLGDALRSGVREVVEARDLAEISNSVGRAHQLHAAMLAPESGQARRVTKQGRLITVFSNKGGVGKTTIATNVAASMAQQGQRVCILDADIEGGDVALMLQLVPNRSLGNLDDLRGVIDGPGVRTLITEHPSPGLSVLAAPLGIVEAEQVKPDDLGQVLSVLLTQFDVVVADTAPAFDDYTMQVLDYTDLLVLVGTLDMLSLKNLKVAAATLDLLGVGVDKIRFVLNRDDAKAGLSSKDFADTLGLEPALTVPTSRDILTSLNKGQELVLASPRHEVSKSISGFATRLLDALGVGASLPDQAETRPACGLFHRGRDSGASHPESGKRRA